MIIGLGRFNYRYVVSDPDTGSLLFLIRDYGSMVGGQPVYRSQNSGLKWTALSDHMTSIKILSFSSCFGQISSKFNWYGWPIGALYHSTGQGDSWSLWHDCYEAGGGGIPTVAMLAKWNAWDIRNSDVRWMEYSNRLSMVPPYYPWFGGGYSIVGGAPITFDTEKGTGSIPIGPTGLVINPNASNVKALYTSRALPGAPGGIWELSYDGVKWPYPTLLKADWGGDSDQTRCFWQGNTVIIQDGTKINKSIDNGFNWTQTDENTATLCVDPNDLNTLIKATLAGAIEKSIDGGTTWAVKLSGVNGNWLDWSYGSKVYLAHDAGFCFSYDAGESWECLSGAAETRFFLA